MATYTVNFGFYKPAVGDGGANDQPWGEAMNANLDLIDTQLKALQPARVSASVTTAVLAPGAREDLPITLARTTVLLTVSTDHPAEVRLYNTSAARIADVGRGALTPGPTGEGLVAQNTLPHAGNLHVHQDPTETFANHDDPVGATGYLAVWNRDGVPRAITVTLTHLPKE